MKNILALLIYMLLNGICFPQQGIQIQLYKSDPCRKSISLIDYYILKNEKDTFNFSKSNSDMLFVKDTGYYKLSCVYLPIDDTIHISHFGIYIDTIIEPKILFQVGIHNSEATGFYCCCEKCEGYQVSYYHTGFKEIEGRFHRGRAIGKLYYYDDKGGIYKVEKYNWFGKLKSTNFIKSP